MAIFGTQDRRLLAAIVFTDIVDYSALVHRDEALGERLLERSRAIVRRLVPRHGGREIETAGDSFLLEFPSALGAVTAVLAIQQAMARAHGDTADPPVSLRASIHLGDVEHRGAKVFGDGVNIAARLLPHSPPGGVAISGPVRGLIRQRLELPLRSIGAPALKNITESVEVFVADAATLQAFVVPESAAPAPSGRRVDRKVAVGLALVMLALAGALVFRGGAPPDSSPAVATPAVPDSASIAVLPLANGSGDPADEYFADGLTEELIGHLARLPDVKVIGRSSSFQFKNRVVDARDVGRRLGVRHLLEGSVRRNGEHLRISALVVDARDGRQVWSQTFERAPSDVFRVQSQIADAVANALQVTLLGGAARPDSQPSNDDLEAYNALLQGNFYVQRRTAADLDKAIAFYEDAVRRDPGYALAWAMLGTARRDRAMGSEVDRAGLLATGRADAEKALSLDGNLAAAHVALGWVRLSADFDHQFAELAFRRALELAPGNSSTHNALASVYGMRGRLEEAVREYELSSRLEPLRATVFANLALPLTALGRLDEAQAAFRKAIELQPGAPFTYEGLAVVEVLRGRYEAALALARQEVDPQWREIGETLAMQIGPDRDAAQRALESLIASQPDSQFPIAGIYAARQEPDRAFEWLEKAYAAGRGNLVDLMLDPFLRKYRDDPRFLSLCERMGLPRPV